MISARYLTPKTKLGLQRYCPKLFDVKHFFKNSFLFQIPER